MVVPGSIPNIIFSEIKFANGLDKLEVTFKLISLLCGNVQIVALQN